jgi:hypothetical protein
MKNFFKTIILTLFTFPIISTEAQSLLLDPSDQSKFIVNANSTSEQVVGRFNGNGSVYTSLYINNNNPSPAYVGFGLLKQNLLLSYFGLNPDRDFYIGRFNFSAGEFKIRGSGVNAGNIGIGLGFSEPTAALHIGGFTKLGTDAPAIKVKKFTATTGSSQGGIVQIAHGLTSSKILNINVLVEYSTDDYVPSSYESVVGFEFEWVHENGIVFVKNISGNSSQILSKPIKVLITYEE